MTHLERQLFKAISKAYKISKVEHAEFQRKRKAKRLLKAHTVKKLLHSNLPEHVKRREIQKLSGVTSQTRAKSIFFKLRRTPREVKQASEANF